MVACVLVELSSKNIDKTFDYLVPSCLLDSIQVGKRVVVPFGHQTLEGFVLSLKDDSSSFELKEIISVLDHEIVLNDELLSLGRYMKKMTLSTLISCYQVMLPKALKAKRGVFVSRKYDTYLVLNEEVPLKNEMQKKIVDVVKEKGKVLKKELVSISSSSVKTLLKHGVLMEVKEEVYRYQVGSSDRVEKYPLTDMQQSVVNSVLNHDGAHTFLLHGVTGSGKTEVYMEIIEKKIKEGKKAILLVPEISLTPQMIDRFKRRFHENIAVLHSRLSDGEKYDEWRKIVMEDIKIVIGVRSAIFAPLENIGVIIIDEEHTSSYKQENNPKYSALMVAKWRSNYHSCPLVLGSATPSLESFARASKGVYTLLSLPERVNHHVLPFVSLVDMNQVMKRKGNLFSPFLEEAIRKRLETKEQVMLLLNRRGYASFLSCKNCGYVLKCPHCDISLTYHKTSSTLRCHYCGYATKPISICPSCKEEAMTSLGIGTEQVEEILHELFPSSSVLRMDLDTTTKKGSHEEMIRSFGRGEYDILLGTQMIAKGLDFHNVTLVGVINADTSLNIPDFRSSEVTFQLLSQVAGRSGRGTKEGEVIIQTYNPTHYALQYVRNHDYLGFYQEEMKLRRQLKYPPYYYLVSIRVMSKDYEIARNESVLVARFLKEHLFHTILLGPSVCSLFKVNNIYRFGIILKYQKEGALYDTLSQLLDHYKGNTKVSIDIDFDPNHL